MPVAPAGWYGDPAGDHEARYWDGANWTDRIADGGATGSDPLAGLFGPPASGSSNSASGHDPAPERNKAYYRERGKLLWSADPPHEGWVLRGREWVDSSKADSSTVRRWWDGLDFWLKFTVILVGVTGVALLVRAAVLSQADPECITVSRATAVESGWDANVTRAVEAPDFQGRDRWYYASPTGGLWISTQDPERVEGGLVSPLNARARSESIIGVDAPRNGPFEEGVDRNDEGAKAALACAR